MSTIQYCLQKARQLPYTKGQNRHYAILLDKRGNIVAESANSYSCTHTQQYKYAKKAGRPEAVYLHSELACLLKDKNRKGIKLIVVRVDSRGNPCYSAPCTICALALKDYSNVKSVEFSV